MSEFKLVFDESYDEIRPKNGVKEYTILKVGELWLKFVLREKLEVLERLEISE